MPSNQHVLLYVSAVSLGGTTPPGEAAITKASQAAGTPLLTSIQSLAKLQGFYSHGGPQFSFYFLNTYPS